MRVRQTSNPAAKHISLDIYIAFFFFLEVASAWNQCMPEVRQSMTALEGHLLLLFLVIPVDSSSKDRCHFQSKFE